jgi:hypothetical protein
MVIIETLSAIAGQTGREAGRRKNHSGSGGLRKLRWSAGGHGKRGGIKVIYYWFVSPEVVLMLFAYPKNERDDLTPDQLKQLKKIVEGESR